MKHMKILVVAIALVFVAAYLISTRYQIVPAGDTARLWLLDTWTGHIYFCNPVETRRDCQILPKQ